MKLKFKIETNTGTVLQDSQQFYWMPVKGAKITVNGVVYIVTDVVQYEYEDAPTVHGVVYVRLVESDYVQKPFLDSPSRSRTPLRSVAVTGDRSQSAVLKKGLKTP